MDILVSYECGHFGRARREIRALLRRIGDPEPHVARSSVDGVALVQTSLDGREVAQRCREMLDRSFVFECALKWVPVDYWCETDLDALRKLLAEQVCPQILPDETWGMRVFRRGWEQHHTRDIVAYLAPAIDRRVNLEHPDKLVHVDVLGARTAVSVLRPGDVFSVPRERAAHPTAQEQGVPASF